MASLRYEVDYESAPKWLIEEMMENVLDYDTEPIKCTITDLTTGKSVSAVGDGDDDALEKACSKMGISPRELEEELDE